MIYIFLPGKIRRKIRQTGIQAILFDIFFISTAGNYLFMTALNAASCLSSKKEKQ
jgi:hypothetical protein